MEKKLAEYRSRKQREELISKTKQTVQNWISPSRLYDGLGFGHQNNRNMVDEARDSLIADTHKDHMSESDYEVDETFVLPDEELDKINCFTYKQLLSYVITFTIWAGLYALFIQWGFGCVYFILSCLIGMYLNTRTARKRKNEVSAYSVFNKNCASIKGTVKAEDLERQMIFGQMF